jgi:DNA repair photolyase
MKPIYKPAGRALEYSPDALACNIYTGCPHRCYYCFAPWVLRKDREEFHSCIEPRKNIVDEVKRQLDKEQITGKLIHLCFTCDPYPIGYDTTPTREVIKAIKAAGCHVQILTKAGMSTVRRDLELLDNNDWFGVTITGKETNGRDFNEPGADTPRSRTVTLELLHRNGVKTWVSAEPVIDPQGLFDLIRYADFVDLYRIGKLNYHPSTIDWAAFGHEVERLCKEHGRSYYIKADLRTEMAKRG